MSICDKCIHDEVCGLEDNHEEAVTFCSDMIPKDVLDKIRVEIGQKCCITVGRENDPAITLYDVFQIIDKYKAESEQVGNPDRLKGD